MLHAWMNLVGHVGGGVGPQASMSGVMSVISFIPV